jgi:adenylate kinase
MYNLVLFGPPGCGKGTQSEKLIEQYGFVHLSTGNLLRAEIANQTPLGLEAKTLMDQGKLVPNQVVISMISSKIDENPDAAGFLYDGFPRTVAQAEALDKLLLAKGNKIDTVLALQVETEELVRRILKRGESSGRSDDTNEEIIRNRIKVYYNETAVVGDYYSNQNKFNVIDGVGSIDQIFEKLSSFIKL